MTLHLKQDNHYAIEQMQDSTWCRVKCEDKIIALVMNKETARQVIYKDIIENGHKCDYLYAEDFE